MSVAARGGPRGREGPRRKGVFMSDIVEQIKQRAASRHGRVILSEGEEQRTVEAARTLVDEGTCDVTLLGSAEGIMRAAKAAGVGLEGVDCVDAADHPDRGAMAEEFYNLRKHKGVTREEARELVADPLIAAALLVRLGKGTGTVGGAVHATRDVVRAALWCIGMSEGVSVVSGGFLMVVPDFLGGGEEKALYFADAGVVPDPDAEQLASIAVASAGTFQALTGEEPKIAMISFSTKGSASHPDVDKVVDATKRAQELRPDLAIDGELQVDAALVREIAERKAPGSPVGGEANVLIFPSLEAANVAYKLMQRLGNAEAIGPVLMGTAKPVHVLQQGDEVRDIVNIAALAVVDAQAQS